jgi:hypothetical protein
MKRIWAAAVWVLALSCAVSAAPIVELSGNMYVYSARVDAGGTNRFCDVARLSWGGGFHAGYTRSVYHEADYGVGSYVEDTRLNFDVYNGDVYVLALDDPSDVGNPSILKVDGMTGSTIRVFRSTKGTVGPNAMLAIDHSTGDIYLSSAGSKQGIRLHDGNGDGIFDGPGELTVLNNPVGIWGLPYSTDAQFYNGSMYFTGTSPLGGSQFLSRLSAGSTDNGSVVAGFPSSPRRLGAPLSTESLDYFALGDPDRDGRTDMYALMPDPKGSERKGVLGHWEDANGDGKFSASEMVDNIVIRGHMRDVELVTDKSGSAMLVFIDKRGHIYYNNLDNNNDARMLTSHDDRGQIASIGLLPSDNSRVYLRFDTPGTGTEQVPEPATCLLITAGAGLLGYLRRRRAK